MASRCAFLSSSGDPFILGLVLKLYRERWGEEIDHLYICYNNNNIPFEVSSEVFSRYVNDKKVRFIYHPNRIGNGMPITQMTLISDDDLVMLLEDDGFIFEKGAINDCFQKIESDLCDAIGSPRGSCGQELWDSSRIKYSLDYTGYGDQGPNFWPNFFFCKRKDLLKTDLNFASKTFTKGEYCKELDYTFKEINHGDTFVWACMQLRAMGLRFHNIPQHKADVYEIENKEKKEMNWHPTQQPFKWIHGGSLSSGWNGYLGEITPDVSTDGAKQEIETRVSFWSLCSDIIDGFDSFKIEYKNGINRLIERANLDKSRIEKKIKIYRDLMRI